MTKVNCNAVTCKYNQDNICINTEITLSMISIPTDYSPVEYTDCQSFKFTCPNYSEPIIDFAANKPLKQVTDEDELR